MLSNAALADYIRTHPTLTARTICHNLRRHKLKSAQVNPLLAPALRTKTAGGRPGALNHHSRLYQKSAPTETVPGLSRKQFAAQFDHDTKLRAAIQNGVHTLTSLDDIVDDSTFRRERCGNAKTSGWKEISGEEQFRKYRFSAGHKIHWAHPKTKEWALENVHGATDL